MPAFSNAQAIPQGVSKSPLGFLKGTGMIPIPSITGGAAGPATSGGIGEQGNIGAITFGDVYNRSSKSPWVTFLIIGVVAYAGYRLWKK